MIYFLFESSLGYSLFKLNNLDKLSLNDPKIIKAISSFQKFKQILSLEGTFFFHGHGVAWKTIEELKKGKLPENLVEFLETYLP